MRGADGGGRGPRKSQKKGRLARILKVKRRAGGRGESERQPRNTGEAEKKEVAR